MNVFDVAILVLYAYMLGWVTAQVSLANLPVSRTTQACLAISTVTVVGRWVW